MIKLTSFDFIDEQVLDTLCQALVQNAIEKNAPPYKETALSILVHDENDRMIGGLTGKTFWDWLYIDILWIDKNHRAQGLGSRLVQQAESMAIQRGCHASYLWTESFEGPDFYPRLGYARFVTKDDFPTGYQRIGFMKKLVTSKASDEHE